MLELGPGDVDGEGRLVVVFGRNDVFEQRLAHGAFFAGDGTGGANLHFAFAGANGGFVGAVFDFCGFGSELRIEGCEEDVAIGQGRAVERDAAAD